MIKVKNSLLIIYLVIFVGLIATSFIQFQLFHLSVSMITVFFGLFAFVLSYNCRKYTENIVLLVIGVIYLYLGVLDFLHAVSYQGLNIIFNDTNISSQFFVSARLLEATSFFVIFVFLKNKTKVRYTVLHLFLFLYTFLTIFIISSDILPKFFIAGTGPTMIKIVIEHIVIVLYILTIIAVTKVKHLSPTFKNTICVILVIKILSELSFTKYSNNTDIFIIIGHLLNYLSYLGLYIIFVSEILLNPKQKIYSLFQKNETDLLALSQRDQLTQLYNHQTTFIKIEELIKTTKENRNQIFIAMIDIDDFKILNDTYGHQYGDQVLTRFSKLLLDLDCGQKIVGRYGGDEFLIYGHSENNESRDLCFKKAQNKMIKEFNDIEIPVTFSVGIAFYKNDDTLKDLIYKADINLYKSKRNGKNKITY